MGQRVHHGATGCALAAGLLIARRPIAAVACLALVAHDRRDWRIWFSREKFVKALDSLTPTD